MVRRGWLGSSPSAWARTEGPGAGCISVKTALSGHRIYVLDQGMIYQGTQWSARDTMCRPHDSGYPMDPSPNARSLGHFSLEGTKDPATSACDAARGRRSPFPLPFQSCTPHRPKSVKRDTTYIICGQSLHQALYRLELDREWGQPLAQGCVMAKPWWALLWEVGIIPPMLPNVGWLESKW